MPSRVKTGLGCRQGLRLQFQVFRVSDRLLESSSLPLRVCTNRMLESGASGRGPKSGTQMAACGSLITVITTRPNLHPPPLGFWIAYCLWLLGLSTVCFACDHFFSFSLLCCYCHFYSLWCPRLIIQQYKVDECKGSINEHKTLACSQVPHLTYWTE